MAEQLTSEHISADGITANKITSGQILTHLVQVSDENGHVKFTGEGIKVFDALANLRVHLGQYEQDEFGFMVKDDQGASIIDARGVMQSWQEGRTDNVDGSNDLSLFIYIPPETREIKKCVLRMRLLNFRSYSWVSASDGSYSSSTPSGGGHTTPSGGGHSSSSEAETVILDSDASKTETSQTSNLWDQYAINIPSAVSNNPNHDHGIPNNTGIEDVDGNTHWFSASGSHSHALTSDHRHDVDIPSHNHGVSTGGHSHYMYDHSHQVSNHSHGFSVPNHTHNIQHGIYTGGSPGSVGVIINGTNRTSALGGSWSSNQNNIDITDYMIVNHWNEIRLTSNQLGRIDATVFIQAMINTEP